MVNVNMFSCYWHCFFAAVRNIWPVWLMSGVECCNFCIHLFATYSLSHPVQSLTLFSYIQSEVTFYVAWASVYQSSMCWMAWNHRWHKKPPRKYISLQWRHNERDGVSNHQPHDYLLSLLFRHISKELAFMWAVSAPHKGPVTRKMFPFDNVVR